MKESSAAAAQAILWDYGTAYDLFISLKVLHEPASVGLRPSWAAGVRSRLPQNERKFLEEIYSFFWIPLLWVYNLPPTKGRRYGDLHLAPNPPRRTPDSFIHFGRGAA